VQVSTVGEAIAEESREAAAEPAGRVRFTGMVLIGTLAATAMVVTSTRIGSGLHDAPAPW
jgi:ribose/xylose/arabinose/galactoside ABC-type transport system permease subunit